MSESPGSYRLTRPEISEGILLEECRRACLAHPQVAGVLRINSGFTSRGNRPIHFYKLWQSGQRDFITRGMPDLLVFLKGGAAWMVEIKRARSRPSEWQERLHQWSRDNRLPIRVVDSPRAITDLLEDLSRAR